MHRLPGYFNDSSLFRHGGTSLAPGDCLDFSASINPLGPPRSVLQTLLEHLGDVARYPDRECRLLVERLAAWHEVDPAQIVVGNGSNDLIYSLTAAYQPRRVAVVEPTYTEYFR